MIFPSSYKGDVTPPLHLMPLIRVADAFDHPDWLFELKHDGFRALAQIDGHRCALVFRRRHVHRQFPQLQEEIAPAIRAESAVRSSYRLPATGLVGSR
jgi:ATP-dependent DNA ligase